MKIPISQNYQNLLKIFTFLKIRPVPLGPVPIIVPIILILVLGLRPAIAAEELDEPIVCNGDSIEYFEAEKKIVGYGNVVIEYKDATLTCDKVTVWPETKEAEAEGDVKLTQADNVFEGERLVYNFETETGSVIGIRAHVPPWYAGGEKADRYGKEKMVVRKGYLTTCDHKRPHWKLTARRVLIYPDKKVTVLNSFAWINPFGTKYDIPVMWIPYYSHPLDENRPRVTIIPGRSGDWGNYVLTAWRYNLTPNQKGYVRIDYREKKDLAVGLDHIYDTKVFGKGTIKTYYMNERDLIRKHAWHKWTEEKDAGPTPEREKGLLRIRHQWDMSPTTQLTGELHKYKDKNFLKDYFYNEYEKDEHPETYLLVTHAADYANLSLLTKKRMNRFDEVVERLPDGQVSVYNVRLFDTNFYYSGNFGAANLNKVYPRHTDEDPGTITDQKHTNRYDGYSQLAYKTKLGFLSVTPFAGIRQTYYDKIPGSGEAKLRGIFRTGVDASTKFYKIYYTKASPFGMEINDLRHIITPTFSYNYSPKPTLEKNKLFHFDSIDRLDRKNLIKLGLENKLQTKRGKVPESVDLAMLLITTEYDFQHTPGTQFLDYKAELELKPFNWLIATSNAVIDSHQRHSHDWLKELNNDLSLTPHEKFSFGLGHRYTHDSNSIILQSKLGFIDGWRLTVYQDFNFKGHWHGDKKINEWREQQYVLTRKLHCWEMDIRYDIRREEGESIMIVFRLTDFPDIPFEFGKTYHRPKVGSQAY